MTSIDEKIYPYCREYIDSEEIKNLGAEYPTLKYSNVNLTFFETWLPLMFWIGFGTLTFFTEGDFNLRLIRTIMSYAAGEIISGVVFLNSISRYLLVSSKGKDVTTTVCGYSDDASICNGTCSQVVKLLVETKRGKRIIFHPLMSINRPYEINSNIHIKVYRNKYLVVKEKAEE